MIYSLDLYVTHYFIHILNINVAHSILKSIRNLATVLSWTLSVIQLDPRERVNIKSSMH